MKKFLSPIVKAIAIIIGIIIIAFIIFWITHPSEVKQSYERGIEDAENGVYHPNISESKATTPISELDKTVKEYLEDNVLDTRYEDNTYYVMISIEGVNKTYPIYSHGATHSFDNLSETIHDNFGIDCVIFVVDYATNNNILYASSNGTDITDLMD